MALAYTLADIAKREDPKGKVDKIVEIMNQTNEFLDDMLHVEGNLPTGHKTTVRTGLPSVTWRLLNYGVQPSKGNTAQITDTCGMLESYAQIDKKLADLNGNAMEFRLSEDKAFIESMTQEYASTLIYGDLSSPEKFVGLAPRYSTRNTAKAASAANVIDGGGSGNTNTSIWLVGWGENTIHGIYPKGSKAGLSMEDLTAGNPAGVTLYDANGGMYQGYRSHYTWDCGLTVRDWRYAVRIANIDVTALTKNASAGADLIDLMTQALETIQSLNGVKASFLCSRGVRSFLRRQITAKTTYQLTEENVAGKPAITFAGVPVRRVDAILSTEATVTAV